MPVLQTSTLLSPPTNAFGLVQYLQQRLPGYDPSEYLRELNSSYVHVWEEVCKLKNNYFTSIRQATVAPQSAQNFDLLFNADGNLSVPISQRLYQITRIRIQPTPGSIFQTTLPVHFNDPDALGIEANPNSGPASTGPYYWWPFGRGQIRFGAPLAQGSVLEVTFTSWPIAMIILQGGTISSIGTAVTGNGTNFTQLVQPDFISYLPSAANPGAEQIQAELVCIPSPAVGASQIFRVTQITDDTHLTLQTAPTTNLAAGSLYALATLPEIPREHIRVIASISMGKMYSIDGDDTRTTEWTAIAEKNIAMMKDSLVERQGQAPPRKQRFPGSISRSRNRTWLH